MVSFYLPQRHGAGPEAPWFANATVRVAKPTVRRAFAVASVLVGVSFGSGHVVGVGVLGDTIVPYKGVDI